MAGLDFPTIGAQVAWWENHITKRFMGGWSGSGENGVDIGMPQGTPVYALSGGRIVGHGYYGGGGVVSVQEAPGRVWYYQHLDLNEPGIESGATRQVAPGQLVGWSGGQLSGGNHPSSSRFSGGPHIEVGINAPWGGIWGPKDIKGPNIDPWPSISALGRGAGTGTTGTPAEPRAVTQQTTQTDCPNAVTIAYVMAWSANSHLSDVAPPGTDWSLDALVAAGCIPVASGAYSGVNTVVTAADIWNQIQSMFGTLFTWLKDPLRILKLVGGGLILLAATGLTLMSLTAKVAPDALQVAGVATGQPELVVAGKAAKAAKSGNAKGAATGFAKTRRRKQSPKQATAKPSQAPQTEGEPVYMDGKRVGTARDGKITMNQGGTS